MTQMPHPSHDVPGTLRREPGNGLAHALCLDQGIDPATDLNHPLRWQVSDAYGRMDNRLTHDNDVSNWPVVYVPAPTDQWAAKTSHLNAHPTSLDEQENTR